MKSRFIKLRHAMPAVKEELTSLGISLLIHFLFVVMVNGFVNFPASAPRFEMRTLSFDFVMNSKEAAEAKPAPARKSPRRTSSSPAASPASGDLSPRQIAASAPGQTSGLLNEREARGPAASDAPVSLLPSLPEVWPNTARLTPKLIPYKFAMPSPQRQAILKKVKALVARPIPVAMRDSSFTFAKDGRRFQFNVRQVPASSSTGLDELWVGVSTVEGDDTLTTQFRLKRMAFSQFAQFVDFWDPQVAIHDDEFDGRFHSNSALVISSSAETKPQFRGKVTTAAYSIRNSSTSPFVDEQKVFLAGLEQGADHIPLPRAFLGIPRDTSRATGHVNVFREETWITFHRDGNYTWHTSSAPEIEHHAKLSVEPSSLIGRAKLHVKGVVKGMVLVYSENDIIINDDLLYAQHPEGFAQSQDFLGLVANKDIEIAPPSITGPGDLRIFAAMLAKGRFRVRQLHAREVGTLHIYGSLSAGSISATEPRYGTRIHFDKRFETMRPPHFPMTNKYEITEWDELWQVK